VGAQHGGALVSAAGVVTWAAYQFRRSTGAKPMNLEIWRKFKDEAFRPKVFTDATKAEISWADPEAVRAAMAKQQKVSRFVLPILLLAGVGLLFLGAHLHQKTGEFLARAVRAPGNVVEMATNHSSDGADTYAPEARDNSAEFRAAGLPSGGGFATARGMAAFYQMLLGRGRLGNVRLFSPRLIAYVSRNHTGERGDEQMNGIPMHRGLGPHVRGESDRIRGLGTLGAPSTFGHGGVGSSYSWADPESGVSFTYLTNFVSPDPWHSMRLDRVSNLVHAAID